MNKKVINIPNILSVLRVLLVPLFIYLYIKANETGEYLRAAGILALSGITDMLDGSIARKYNMITDAGKVLDPFADKLTQGAVCICLAIKHPTLAPILIILILKEIIIFIGGVFIYKKEDFVVSPNIFGKIYTAVFFVLMTVIVAFPHTESVLRYLLWALLICNIATLIKYICDFNDIRKKSRKLQKSAD